MPMTATILLTVNDRPVQMLRNTADALNGTAVHVVYDGTPPPLKAILMSKAFRGAGVSVVKREPGWICPARAWNTGFSDITSEYVICISSDVILKQGSVDRIFKLISGPPVVVFGKCVDDGPEPLINGPNPNLLCSAEQQRPLGFIVAMPMWAVRTVGGYDEAFMDGLWYEDDDFMTRLFATGVPFVFDDAVSGVHQHHQRPVLDTQEGLAKVKRNRALIISKHGEEHPWNSVLKTGWKAEGMVALALKANPALLEAWTKWARPLLPQPAAKPASSSLFQVYVA